MLLWLITCVFTCVSSLIRKSLQDQLSHITRNMSSVVSDQVRLNIKSEMRSFKINENIHKKEGGSYYVVSANKASSVTL